MRTKFSLTTILIVAIVVLVVGFIFLKHRSTSTQNQPAPTTSQNQFIFPTSNDTLIKGDTYTLKWTGGPEEISIFLIDTSLESQGVSVSLADRIYGVKNTGFYEYAVPANIPDGEYKFQIGEITSEVFRISSNIAEGSDCSIQDLSPEVSLEGAAGSTYASLSIKNNSNENCTISGENSPRIEYDSSVKNIKVAIEGGTKNQNYTLEPGSAIYSTVRYPNGAQCNSSVKQVNMSFIYRLSGEQVLTFKDSQEKETFNIAACSAETDITEVNISPFSTLPNS